MYSTFQKLEFRHIRAPNINLTHVVMDVYTIKKIILISQNFNYADYDLPNRINLIKHLLHVPIQSDPKTDTMLYGPTPRKRTL
jgi:hypothetical protein